MQSGWRGITPSLNRIADVQIHHNQHPEITAGLMQIKSSPHAQPLSVAPAAFLYVAFRALQTGPLPTFSSLTSTFSDHTGLVTVPLCNISVRSASLTVSAGRVITHLPKHTPVSSSALGGSGSPSTLLALPLGWGPDRILAWSLVYQSVSHLP